MSTWQVRPTPPCVPRKTCIKKVLRADKKKCLARALHLGPPEFKTGIDHVDLPQMRRDFSSSSLGKGGGEERSFHCYTFPFGKCYSHHVGGPRVRLRPAFHNGSPDILIPFLKITPLLCSFAQAFSMKNLEGEKCNLSKIVFGKFCPLEFREKKTQGVVKPRAKTSQLHFFFHR